MHNEKKVEKCGRSLQLSQSVSITLPRDDLSIRNLGCLYIGGQGFQINMTDQTFLARRSRQVVFGRDQNRMQTRVLHWVLRFIRIVDLVLSQVFFVGWVERSETQHVLIMSIMSGFASLYPTYNVRVDSLLVLLSCCFR